MVERQFCAQASRDAADPFIGTAARADLWLLIEYTGAWQRNEIQSSALPAQVKDWINHARTFYMQTRLIKRNKSKSESITVFVASTLEQRQAIYRFQLERYEELLCLDLEALRDEHSCYQRYLYNDPLFLVCTHGKHDACCAKFGMPVYNEMERLAGDYTWQSSHVGGDKFAANVVCMPQNIYYGRVAVSEVSDLIVSSVQSQVYLKRYRGRGCYQPVVQAAECLLRERCGETNLHAFRLLEERQVSELDWWVCFESTCDGARHCLLVQERVRENPSYHTTCHAEGKSTNKSYHLRYYRMLEPPKKPAVQALISPCSR
jgi:hypothetical protein